ncbi:hypothetical protein VNO78_20431 [Psophocarpus tetragonolobus]|uniref:Uncharacterized protein n=1 Tax=Psophocarpus tetragonolobus TaxID=3891 RepID=A0AAN9XH54_PSOTE
MNDRPSPQLRTLMRMLVSWQSFPKLKLETVKMACLVSSSFAVPTPDSPLNKLGVYQLRLDFALDRLLSKANIRAAQNFLGYCSSKKHILSVKGSCQRCLLSCTRFLHETYTHSLDIDDRTEIVIYGYWVGPDADDGWGFVEAVVNQMN